MHYRLARVSTCAFLAFCRLLARGDKQDSVGDLENDQGARLAKNRGFALQSFAMTRDMDREHTLSVRLDWFADCGYWSSWHRPKAAR